MFLDTSASILQAIEDDIFKVKKVSVFIKREDQLHPLVSGNKWRKLKYNIQEALNLGHHQVLTFGGAYSNHILATAAAANIAGLSSIGIIRGEEADLKNPTLSRAISEGMLIKRVSRTDYKLKKSDEFISNLKTSLGDFYTIPEGGSNLLAVKGVAELMKEIPDDTDYIVAAVGTGATLAGIIEGSNQNQLVIGIPVLKGAEFLESDIENLLSSSPQVKRKGNWSLIHDYHFEGYAKFNHGLIQFINAFKRNTSIPLDPIYTGKLMFGVFSLIRQGFFSENSKIVVIHTGGVQGIEGFNERFGQIIL